MTPKPWSAVALSWSVEVARLVIRAASESARRHLRRVPVSVLPPLLRR
jgi:hypothetical protein